ncbi:MAG: STAS domain-containing protein [Betaproteobacteria bacterium]|nr:STAS domain-containing protein [Betaproteobacteria bacterium]
MRVEADIAYPEGDWVLSHATRWLEEGRQAMEQGCACFDLAGVGRVDSSALSLLMAWRRTALTLGRPLTFRNIPASMSSLAALYGVAEFLDS